MLNFLVLGAGPSGLTFAHQLKQLGENSFLVLEKESDAGGLCRSRTVDGAALDIGGGHFLDTRRKHVNAFLFKFLPEENWNHFKRISKISLKNCEVDYPLESNLFQLMEDDQVEYLYSIARSGEQQGNPMPSSFSDWIYWKFGTRIAEDYMIPYNKKIWSIDLDRLGTKWLHKLPSVDFRETLKSCLCKKAEGQIPAHNEFLYPKKGGYGQLWQALAERLGEQIKYQQKIEYINIHSRVLKTTEAEYVARNIVTTIPWHVWTDVANLPPEINTKIKSLEYTSLEVGYHRENLQSEAHWIYIPDESVPHHRILNRRTFVTNSRGYWTETNTKRVGLKRQQPEWKHINEFAYPVNTHDKAAAIQRITEWALQERIYPLGRWGKWEHMNSDVATEEALLLANQLVQQ